MYLGKFIFPQSGLHQKMYKTEFVHYFDVIPNLVVDIEIFNFCLLTCLFVPHVLLISQKENVPIMIPKTVLKSGL